MVNFVFKLYSPPLLMDSTCWNDELTVYVDDPPLVIFLPISHPDGLDLFKEIQIGLVGSQVPKCFDARAIAYLS